MTAGAKVKMIPVGDLHFDHANPRLAEYGISDGDAEDEIMRVLWEAMDVQELAQSIAASGYFPHETLIVTCENGRYVVIEGNRRLAAVKLLLSPQIAQTNGWEIQPISEDARRQLERLPAIVSKREDSWRFHGFKHVNGPAKWTSYAKACFIAHVHRDYGAPLSEIANQLGDRRRTVQCLYRGLMAIEQAEREGVYDRDDRYNRRFAFSHLYIGLDYDGIRAFLDLKNEDEEAEYPIPKSKVIELGELFVWLYGSRRENRKPLIQSQDPDLGNLDVVLQSRGGIAALRAGGDLVRALEISQSPADVFERALYAAKRELTTTRAYLTNGYDLSEAQLRLAGTIADLADDLYVEMERKRNPRPAKRRLAEV